LTGSADITLEVGGAPYMDAGAVAEDNFDADTAVLTPDSVDINTIGDYLLHYNYTDTNGNAAAEVTRTVHVVAHDTTPDQFAFSDQNDVGLDTVIESNEITVNGTSVAVDVSVVGGEYSINGGVFTAVAGMINTGDSIKVRHTSSTLNDVAVNTVLTIGGVSDTFTSTTLAARHTVSGGGRVALAGEVLGVSTENPLGQVLGAEKFIFTMLLKMGHFPYPVGDYANEVMELQKFLNAAPYNSGLVIDGKFGPKTLAAVIKFQLANGLVGDGIVGPLTRAVLNK
jgi:hypothetical protein